MEHTEPKQSYSALHRILAILGLVVIAGLLIALFVTLITGGSPGRLLAILFCLIVIPCVLWAFALYIRHTTGAGKN